MAAQSHDTASKEKTKGSAAHHASLAASIPPMSAERLRQAEDTGMVKSDLHGEANTVLYLAYGSNLSASTFLGMRGIRPLSQMNVSVPALMLNFNLPGIPYQEPCFANVEYRKHPKAQPRPDPKDPIFIPPDDETGEWKTGLMGVVYEVTREDFRNIIRTEGGGFSYKEIAVQCIPISPQDSDLEKPQLPGLSRPILARTLYAPYKSPGELPPDVGRKGWFARWFHWWLERPFRPDPNYAQPSLRYLNLLRVGAQEHELPAEYQAWLNSLQPYLATTLRQRIGKAVFSVVWLPLLMFIMKLSGLLAGKDGRMPYWMGASMSVLFHLSLLSYDYVLKPIFGDGERTQGSKRCGEVEAGSVEASVSYLSAKEEEMVSMMGDGEHH